MFPDVADAFDKNRLAPDVLAGLTLAALGIPEAMGYTKIIGTPVVIRGRGCSIVNQEMGDHWG